MDKVYPLSEILDIPEELSARLDITLDDAKRLHVAVNAYEKDQEVIKGLVKAVRGLLAAHKSYSNEFNPGGKVRKVADWALINDAFMDADAAIAKATQ